MDPNAQHGFAAAASYDAHRPSFPSESLDKLLEGVRARGAKHVTVVDLGAGTGKFTELLAARNEGFRIVAVDPHDDMRAVLEKKKLPGVEVANGSSTNIPLADGEADAVIASQSFHWFANMDSLKEIHRVLQPHGAFGMIWNIEDYNAPRDHKAATSWEKTMQDFIWSMDDKSPRFRHEKWRAVFDEQLKSNPFSLTTSADPLFALPLAEFEERWTVALPQEKVWDRLNTLSQISILKGKERDDAVALFTKAVEGEGTERDAQGNVIIHGGTFSYWTTKIPA